MEGFAAVAHRIDASPGGLLGEIDLDRACLPEREPHLPGQRHFRPDPDGQQNDVRLLLAVVRHQAEPMVLPRLHGLRFRLRDEAHFMAPELVQNDLREFGVPAVHGKRPAVVNAGLDPEIPERLAHLHPDETGPDDDRLPAGDLFEPRLDTKGVGEPLQREDSLPFLAGDPGQKRRRSRPQDEEVVG